MSFSSLLLFVLQKQKYVQMASMMTANQNSGVAGLSCEMISQWHIHVVIMFQALSRVPLYTSAHLKVTKEPL